MTIIISFTLYSKYINYLEIPFSEIIQLAPLARDEWGPVWERFQLLLRTTEFFITDDQENEYNYKQPIIYDCHCGCLARCLSCW